MASKFFPCIELVRVETEKPVMISVSAIQAIADGQDYRQVSIPGSIVNVLESYADIVLMVNKMFCMGVVNEEKKPNVARVQVDP